MAVTTGFATLANTSLYYEMRGTGNPLILLHSGLTDHRMWSGQQEEFSQHFQVILPDFRGYGKSPVPVGLFRHYEDIYELIQYLKFNSVNVLGCSLGGKTGLELAIAYPEVVDRLILVAPGLRGYEYQDPETLARDEILEKLIAIGKREEVADMLVDIWVVGLKRERKSVNSEARALIREMILDNYESVIDKYPEKEPEFDMIARLDEIRSPTLLMIGDSDLPDMQAISKLIADRIPGAKRRLIVDAAHLPNMEDSQRFNQSVIEFLTQNC
jgi:3-oxoadipate enol-lactonase